DHALGDQLGDARADHVHAEDAIGLGMRQHLHLADGLVHRDGAADRGEREAADLVRDAGVLQVLFGLAGPGDFRLGVDHPRDGVVVDVTGLAGDPLGHRHAFLGTLVRQHRAAHRVADRPNAIDAGVVVLVDHDAAALVQLHASILAPKPDAIARAIHCDEHSDDNKLKHSGPIRLYYTTL